MHDCVLFCSTLKWYELLFQSKGMLLSEVIYSIIYSMVLRIFDTGWPIKQCINPLNISVTRKPLCIGEGCPTITTGQVQ